MKNRRKKWWRPIHDFLAWQPPSRIFRPWSRPKHNNFVKSNVYTNTCMWLLVLAQKNVSRSINQNALLYAPKAAFISLSYPPSTGLNRVEMSTDQETCMTCKSLENISYTVLVRSIIVEVKESSRKSLCKAPDAYRILQKPECFHSEWRIEHSERIAPTNRRNISSTAGAAKNVGELEYRFTRAPHSTGPFLASPNCCYIPITAFETSLENKSRP